MKIDNLSFGNFNEIEPNILEIIAHEGVEIKKSDIILLEEYLHEKYPKVSQNIQDNVPYFKPKMTGFVIRKMFS